MSTRFKLSKPILEATLAQTILPEPPVVPVAQSHHDDDEEPQNDSNHSSNNSSDSDQEPTQTQYAGLDVPSPPTTLNRIINEEQFWNYVESMNWRDRTDEPNFNLALKKQNFRRLSIADQEAFADFLTHCVNALNEVLISKNFFGALEDETERKAICSHIVGRGSIFYAMTMEDPGFAMHLVPENLSKKEYFDMMELIKI